MSSVKGKRVSMRDDPEPQIHLSASTAVCSHRSPCHPKSLGAQRCCESKGHWVVLPQRALHLSEEENA